MGTNYYLIKKCSKEELSKYGHYNDDFRSDSEPKRLTNGFIYRNTYYPTEEELLKIAGHDNSYIENLLKKKNELGEVRDMDYEIASTTVKDVVVKYAISKIFDVTHSHKNSIDLKERIIQYQVNLWQNK